MAMSDRPILIKKVKKVAGHGHHGGAWKVAYADFVTAMMAFFLLMWLINTTDPEQKRGIQLVDQEGRSMFEQNSARPNERARVLLRAISRVINQLPNRITISGHTSATGTRASAPGDWALSSGRADASRQILEGAGVDADRIYQVSGKAGSDPLYPDDPTLAGNRRIAIILLREAPVLPADTSL